MTANHAHTPSTEDIELVVLAQLKQTAERHGFPHDIEADRADFRRWYNGELAAAEQRGAERVLKYFQDHVNEVSEYSYIGAAIQELIVQASENRADQMEGDNANQGGWCYAEHCTYRGTGKMPTHRRYEHCPVWRTND